MLAELVKGALVLVIGFVLKWFFALINFPIDEAVFNALLGAIVAYLLALFGLEGVKKVAPRLF